MKKFIAFILAIILLATGTFTVCAQDLGDTDNNGKITITDATAVQRHIARMQILDEQSLSAADVSGDGKITILDCTNIQRFVAHVIEVFPAQEKNSQSPTTPTKPPIEISTNSGFSDDPTSAPVVPTQPPTVKETQPPTEYNAPNDYDLEVLELVNIERKKAGVAPLEYAYFIFDCAKVRANECAPMAFFSHTRPDGTPWHTVLEQFNKTDFHTAGENLAWGHETAQEVMYSEYGWMNSEGHKNNILNPKFTHVAIASVECIGQKGTFCTVQIFWS